MTMVPDEYVDYSCSTALERLARDVETVLRSWHVDSSDRHVSFHSAMPQLASHPGSPVSAGKRQDLELQNTTSSPHTPVKRSMSTGCLVTPGRGLGHSRARSFSTPRRTPAKKKKSNSLLIRSGKVYLATALPNNVNPNDRVTVELMLSLWDGPLPPSSLKPPRHSALGLPPLPLSLMSGRSLIPDDLTSSLSSLLGIGQHITLTPVSLLSTNAAASFLFATMDALLANNHASTRAAYNDAVANVALHSTALNSLSNMLQTAVNAATQACSCLIPAFGIWGIYNPIPQSHSHVTSTPKKNKHDKTPILHSIMDVPTWINAGNLFQLAAHQSPCTAPLAKKSSRGRGSPKQKVLDIEADDEEQEGTQKVATPKKTQKRSSLAFLSKTTSTTQLFLPPVLTGYCHSGPHLNSARASFVIHVVPPGISYPVHCTTLNSLGQMLLQHCPSRGHTSAFSNEEYVSSYGKVVVSGARHRYHWTKRFDTERVNDAMIVRKRVSSSTHDTNVFTCGIEWRDVSASSPKSAGHDDPQRVETIQYQHQCRMHAMKLIQRAAHVMDEHLSSSSAPEPLWGPSDDPLLSVSISVTWDGRPHSVPESIVEGEPHGDSTPTASSPLQPMPLLTLPLRVRSNKSLSSSDVLEMENSILSTVFNPLNVPTRIGAFALSAQFDTDAACSTLSASNRCLLAALIRASTLDPETLLGHLTQSSILNELHEREGLDDVAMRIMKSGFVGPVTSRLVEVMDWASMSELIASDKRNLRAIVCEALDGWYGGGAGLGYPSPPEGVFRCMIASAVAESLKEFVKTGSDEDPLDNVLLLPKATPPGRLLSVLFSSMASLRTPSAMAALWLEFVDELRERWERRESLPNMGFVPGLDDPSVGGGTESCSSREAYTKKRAANGMGHMAKYAAFVNSSEPEPDTDHCMISQKLQVFNIGIECIVAAEAEELRRHQEDELTDSSDADSYEEQNDAADLSEDSEMASKDLSADSVASTAVMRNVADETQTGNRKPAGTITMTSSDGSLPPVVYRADKTDALHSQEQIILNAQSRSEKDTPGEGSNTNVDDLTPQTHVHVTSAVTPDNCDNVGNAPSIGHPDDVGKGSDHSFVATLNRESENNGGCSFVPASNTSTKDDFFDACANIDTLTNERLSSDESTENSANDDGHDRTYMEESATTHVAQRQVRRGARCPVQGVNLVASGDQLYAPYLQRPPPLTDDLHIQRKALLLANENKSDNKKAVVDSTVQARIAVAHRLQRPKLLSDMRSFKAANPGAVFQDFTNWYGNPGNPLEEEHNDDDDEDVDLAVSNDSERSKDASDAITILMATRAFWSDAWDEAEPCPASEQKPLFDAFSTVEMLLLGFESMHPAHLINQILAVNLSTANFILRASAGPAVELDAVRTALSSLSQTTEDALLQLGKDISDRTTITNAKKIGANNNDDLPDPFAYISPGTTAACERVCNSIGEVEMLLSQATTLLSKFPGERALVQRLLWHGNGEIVHVDSHGGRAGILNAIRRQQLRNSGRSDDVVTNELPFPSVREYILRNRDEDNPCQLSVRMGGTHGLVEGGTNSTKGGLIISVSKCERD